MEPFYAFMRFLFKVASFAFYSDVHVIGGENIPEDGVPTVLCFNHGNGLGDSVVAIRVCKRMIRFCAKDTLWTTPVFGSFIRRSGAVPIKRRQEHADADNTDAIEAILQALADGDLIGFFPEGMSRFFCEMAPLKTGLARIVLASAARSPPVKVRVVPCGITYLGREKWRSDVVMDFGVPIMVGADLVEEYREDSRAACGKLTEIIRSAIADRTFNTPDWETLKIAVGCARLYCPYGTQLPIDVYVKIVQRFIRLLCPEYVPNQTKSLPAEASVLSSDTRDRVLRYERALASSGLRDERIRRVELFGRPSRAYICLGVAVQVVLGLVALLVSVPGTVLLVPAFIIGKLRETQLLRRGALDNADMIAENKMAIVFVLYTIIYMPMAVAGGYMRAGAWGVLLANVALPSTLWVSVRLLEEALSRLRSVLSLSRVYAIAEDTLQTLVTERARVVSAVEQAASGDAELSALGRRARVPERPWSLRSLLVRRKRDWTELMRLRDVSVDDVADG